MKISSWILGVFLLAAESLQPLPASAVSLGQVDDFEDGTTQNWVIGLRGGVHPAPPANVPSGGPAGEGDHYLLLTSLANEPAGNRLAVINLNQWVGNYLGAEVNFLTMDVRNFGPTDLHLRILVEDPEAGIETAPTHIAVSTEAVFVPVSGNWTRVTFSMDPGQFTALKGDAGAALSNVDELRIFHSPTPTFPPPTVDAQLGVDNITARRSLLMATDISADFDGDGRKDLAAWRPAEGNWYILNSLTGKVTVRQWGAPTDQPVSGDFDGDGKADIAVWRPADGNWFILNSLTGTVTVRQWGNVGDLPVTGDFDGDGKTDPAVWRSSEGNWYMVNSLTGSVTITQWGISGDLPVPGDYDGDGKTDIAVWRPADGNWYVVNSRTGAMTVRQWGAAGDQHAPGDYDGDGKTDYAVWRPGAGNWYIVRSSDDVVAITQWGNDGDVPIGRE
ncbi:MAG: VCBS repeat-containing protein [Deltaproteobacteria bacterium]|nr:VCBS repeat-containing protein [Deltaproteobacteria bacterium]